MSGKKIIEGLKQAKSHAEMEAEVVRLRSGADMGRQIYVLNKATRHLQDEIELLRKALDLSTQALNDWLHVYADDMCREEDVAAAKARIRAHGGTLGYITDTLEAIRAAAKGVE